MKFRISQTIFSSFLLKSLSATLVVSVVFLFSSKPVFAVEECSTFLGEEYYEYLSSSIPLTPIDTSGASSSSGQILGNVSVLGATKTSNLSEVCGGIPASTGNFYCDESNVEENVSDSRVDIFNYNKLCKMNVTMVSYPASWYGLQIDDDARVDVREGESYDVARYFGSETGPVEYREDADGAMASTNGDRYYYMEHTYAPKGQPDVVTTGWQAALIQLIVRIVGAGSTNVSNDSSLGVGEAQNAGTDFCEKNPPLIVPPSASGGCPSPVLPTKETGRKVFAMYFPPDPTRDLVFTRLGKGSFINAEDDIEAHAEATTCTAAARIVPGLVSCLEKTKNEKGWLANLSRTLAEATCFENLTCVHDAMLVLDVTDAIGSNEGGADNADIYADMILAGSSKPGTFKNDGTIPGGYYYEDRFIGTYCEVSLCGDNVGAVCTYKDTLYDSWNMTVRQLAPCNPEKDRFCNFEDYEEFVYSNFADQTQSV
ncbi:hypothetical protein JW887_06795 [Candidatus Dojkabacteria bacterium]|nr:hypothetical protein [Candidatus Dojkabacteria bacterium]